jgi:glycosyltransferase involved in cell wall biosynthesis
MPLHGKPKVAHLTSVHPASDTRIAYRECATLAQAGYDVVLIAAGSLAEVPAGVRLHGVSLPRNRFERMTKTIWHVFRAALAERADVYHFHDPELMGVGLALRALGARVVFDVHEDIPQDIIDKPWIPLAFRAPVSFASEIALRALQRGYSAIVAATPAIARRFANPRTIVVANYPRIEELPRASAEQFADRARSVVYLGAITQLRCIGEIMSAFSSPQLASGIRLRLAGHFENDELERSVRAMPGWKNVDFMGFCRRSEVGGVLGSVRAGLLLFRQAANHEEAMPTKLFEYLGAGLPVVISNTLQCCSIVRENDCGIVVDPADSDAISSAISRLVENPAVAQSMGNRGRRLVKEHFQWSSEASKLTRLYAEIA